MKKLILIDGHALVHRAFHALPPTLNNAKGIPTNAVYGFTTILLKAIKDLRPDYIAAAFDLAGPTFRHEQFAEYKEHRVKAPDELHQQVPIVKELLAALGVPVYEQAGFEADDLIGTMATRAKQTKDLQVIIATGDLDALQLVDGKKVMVFTLRKGMADTVIYDEAAVLARFGLQPKQLNDYRGLKGDPSDNIPGVPGIGEKTGSELIKQFGSLDGLYQALENPKSQTQISEKLKAKLLASKDQAYFSKQLSEIICDLKIDFSLAKADWRKNLDKAKLEKIFKDLAFFSLVKRLPELTWPAGQSSSDEIKATTANAKPASTKSNDNKQSSMDFSSPSTPLILSKKTLLDPHQTIIGHDLKASLKPFISAGVTIKAKLFDTMIAAALLAPDLHDYDLAKVYYGQFQEELPDAAVGQSGNHTANIVRLGQQLEDKLKASDLLEVFTTIEMPLIPVLAAMELAGIKVDTKALAKLAKLVNAKITKLEKQIYRQAGEEFNINSPAQLKEILFTKLGLVAKVRKTGKGALSTAASELEKMFDLHPIVPLILEYRELQKLKTTYIDPFPALVGEDGRIHTTYNQTGAATGRLSSENPNLQNIPIKTELGQEFRKAFVAEAGYQLLSFDYSQLELRIVAHVAKDQKMLEVFQRGEDIHTRTAMEIFGVKSTEQVTKEMRRQAKVLNFGIIYGMGPHAFSRAAGMDYATARGFIERYFTEFAGVARYMEAIKQQAHKYGYVQTIFGRRRQFPDIHSTMPQLLAAAERAAINHPIQGTAADLMKLAMIKTSQYLQANFAPSDARLLLQVHDEIVLEAKSNLVKEIGPAVKTIMDSVHKLTVPILAEVKVGDNWQEMVVVSG